MNAQSLQTWKRESLIDWLSRNDKNGIYTDAEAEAEGYEPLTKEEAINTILEQLSQA